MPWLPRAGPSAASLPGIDRRALVFALVLACSQDALYALLFLSYMNHYLLDILGSSAGLPGYTLALYGGTKLVSHPVAGRLIDRTTPRAVFALAVAIQCLGIGLLLSVHTLAAFLSAAVLLAMGSATIWPLAYAIVARTQPHETHTRVTGMLSFGGYIATGAGFAAGVGLTGIAPWRVAFAAAAVLIVAPLLLHREPALNAPAEPTTAPAAAAVTARREGRRRRMVLIGAVIFLDYACISSLAGLYGPYARHTLDISLVRTALLLIPTAIAALASLAAAARFSRPERRFFEMALLYLLAAAGAFAVASTATPSLAAVYTVVLALGLGGIGPLVAATILEAGRGEGQGFVIGSLMSVEGLGSIAGPAATALIADGFGPRAGVAAVGSILAVLVVLTLTAFAHSRS